MCVPAEPRTCAPWASPVSAAVASLHGPVALTTTRAATVNAVPVSRSSTATPHETRAGPGPHAAGDGHVIDDDRAFLARGDARWPA